MSDAPDLAEPQRLLEAASPGPWYQNTCDSSLVDTGRMRAWPADEPWGHEGWPHECLVVAEMPWWAAKPGSRHARSGFWENHEALTKEASANAGLIVAAVNALPFLLARIKELEEALKRIRRVKKRSYTLPTSPPGARDPGYRKGFIAAANEVDVIARSVLPPPPAQPVTGEVGS